MSKIKSIEAAIDEVMGFVNCNKFCRKDVVKIVETFASQFQPEGDGWVRVSEGFPNEGDIVLCIGVGQIANFAIYSRGNFERYIDPVPQDRIMSIIYNKITHWQPLPSKPKEY